MTTENKNKTNANLTKMIELWKNLSVQEGHKQENPTCGQVNKNFILIFGKEKIEFSSVDKQSKFEFVNLKAMNIDIQELPNESLESLTKYLFGELEGILDSNIKLLEEFDSYLTEEKEKFKLKNPDLLEELQEIYEKPQYKISVENGEFVLTADIAHLTYLTDILTKKIQHSTETVITTTILDVVKNEVTDYLKETAKQLVKEIPQQYKRA